MTIDHHSQVLFIIPYKFALLHKIKQYVSTREHLIVLS
jgi:hypothetical protein